MEGIQDNEWHIFLHGNVAASLVVDNADNENNGTLFFALVMIVKLTFKIVLVRCSCVVFDNCYLISFFP